LYYIEYIIKFKKTLYCIGNLTQRITLYRRMGHFFLGGGSSAIFATKIFRQRPINCYATLQNYFAQLTAPNNYQ